jgi:hypothetical protein
MAIRSDLSKVLSDQPSASVPSLVSLALFRSFDLRPAALVLFSARRIATSVAHRCGATDRNGIIA